MKFGVALIIALLLSAPLPGRSETASLSSAAQALRERQCFGASVNVEVILPMAANDEVHYTVEVNSAANPADTLLPVRYLLEWQMPGRSESSSGFASYFTGNNYRYRGGSTILEYHADQNPAPFAGPTPVQRTVQFFELLPWALGTEIEKMQSDTTFTLYWQPDTLYRGKKASVLKAHQVVKGLEAGDITYVFDPADSFRPVYINKEMSPGTISEQTVTYVYTPLDCSETAVPDSEESLVNRYPTAFTDFRQSTYGLKSLVGGKVPAFSLPSLAGDRITRSRGQQPDSPEVIVFLDPSIASTREVAVTVSRTLAGLPFNVEPVWIFLSNKRDEVEEIVDALRLKGTVALSGRNAVKDFGVTETPSLLFVDSSGTVKDVLVGVNKDLADVVLQKTTLLH